MIGERDVDDPDVVLRIDAGRLQIEQQFGVLHRSGRHADRNRVALLPPLDGPVRNPAE
jgi:hypothetical protein